MELEDQKTPLSLSPPPLFSLSGDLEIMMVGSVLVFDFGHFCVVGYHHFCCPKQSDTVKLYLPLAGGDGI